MGLLGTLAVLSACGDDTSSARGPSADARTSEVAAPTPDAIADPAPDNPATWDASTETSAEGGPDQPADTTADQPSDTAGRICGDRRCGPDEFCRAYTFYGGVPGGPPPVTEYTCEPKPTACGTGPVTCACLPQSQCTRPGCSCSEPPTQGHINCTCAAP